MLQSWSHVLQGSGRDMVIANLLGNQLHLQLQAIQLRSHLQQLLLQSSNMCCIALHLCKLLIYHLSNSSRNSQLEEGI